jgi:hypothetical protein
MPTKPSAPALFRASSRPLSWSRKRIKVAGVIAAKSTPITMMTKESVNRSYETTLAEGVRFERRLFSRDVCHQRSEGRHVGLCREAQAEVLQFLSKWAAAVAIRPALQAGGVC